MMINKYEIKVFWQRFSDIPLWYSHKNRTIKTWFAYCSTDSCKAIYNSVFLRFLGLCLSIKDTKTDRVVKKQKRMTKYHKLALEFQTENPGYDYWEGF